MFGILTQEFRNEVDGLVFLRNFTLAQEFETWYIMSMTKTHGNVIGIRRARRMLAAAIVAGDVRTIELAIEHLYRVEQLAQTDQIENVTERCSAVLAALR